MRVEKPKIIKVAKKKVADLYAKRSSEATGAAPFQGEMLKLLEEENIGLGHSHERNLADLQEKERELGELDMREAELEFRIGISNAMVVERIKYLEGEIAECQAQIRDSQTAFERMEEATVNENCGAPDVETILEL